MWTTTVLLLMLSPRLTASADPTKTLNQSEAEVKEDFPDTPADPGRGEEGGVKGRDTCFIPCDITVRLLRDEKQSICGQLQQSLLAFGRSNRKLMRDVMEEQQRALDVLTSQVSEVMNKVQALSAEFQRSNADTFAAKPPLSHGRDCSDIKDSLMSLVPKIPSGIYIVSPDDSDSSFEVFCEMDYMGGGWTVMQRRTDGLVDFKRPWADHVGGFGHLAGEHWLGLKKVFDIVNQKGSRFQLHVALVSHDDVTSYAAYDDFRLDNETDFFRIHPSELARGRLPRLRAGPEPRHGPLQRLGRGQRRLRALLLHGGSDGGELQCPTPPHGVVVQPLRHGQPQRGRPAGPGASDRGRPVGHLETQGSGPSHQVCHHEDQEDAG